MAIEGIGTMTKRIVSEVTDVWSVAPVIAASALVAAAAFVLESEWLWGLPPWVHATMAIVALPAIGAVAWRLV